MKEEIIGDATLYLGDALHVMDSMYDKSVDAVITDPPYGDNFSYGRQGKQITGNQNPLLNCTALAQMPRLLKDSVVINFTSWRHFPFMRMFLELYTPFRFKHLGVWTKRNFGMGAAFRPAYEMFMVLEHGAPAYNRNDFSDVQKGFPLQHNDDSHPHEKPVDLIKGMLYHVSHPQDVILDPFMGSGTTGVACMDLGRKFIGVEIDQKHFDTACKRIDAAERQGKLFV